MSGWRLLLTRPADECAALATTLADAGVFSSALPMLAIEPLTVEGAELSKILELPFYSAAIVVSKPAARLGLDLVDRYWPQPPMLRWFTVGAATAGLLDDYGLRVDYPAEGDDSEALLELPALQEALAQPEPRVLILRGEGGRELLAERLRAQGASVDYLELYRRRLPEYPDGTLSRQIQAERLNGLVVSSGQGFEHLQQVAGRIGPRWPGYRCLFPALGSRRWPVLPGQNMLWIVVVPAPRPCWRRYRSTLYPLSECKGWTRERNSLAKRTSSTGARDAGQTAGRACRAPWQRPGGPRLASGRRRGGRWRLGRLADAQSAGQSPAAEWATAGPGQPGTVAQTQRAAIGHAPGPTAGCRRA